jgi:hypothetical protein
MGITETVGTQGATTLTLGDSMGLAGWAALVAAIAAVLAAMPEALKWTS